MWFVMYPVARQYNGMLQSGCMDRILKGFAVAELCKLILLCTGKLTQLDGGLTWPRPTAQAISLEKFRGTDRSARTVKLFHLE